MQDKNLEKQFAEHTPYYVFDFRQAMISINRISLPKSALVPRQPFDGIIVKLETTK